MVGIFLRPRVVQLLIRANYCNREAYWLGRAGLLNAIRINRQSTVGGVAPGHLLRTLPDGTKYALDVYITDGPKFEPDQIGRWDQWSYQEVLRFVAQNPVWYSPDLKTATFTDAGTDLIFPITFPILFGHFDTTINITYLGTWLDYPTIVITGPIQTPTITNTTTGEKLELDYNVAAGEVVTIDLSYGAKTITNNSGANLIGTLSTDSDLATWHLAPDPEAAGGVNSVMVTGYGSNGSTRVVIQYHDRYFGI